MVIDETLGENFVHTQLKFRVYLIFPSYQSFFTEAILSTKRTIFSIQSIKPNLDTITSWMTAGEHQTILSSQHFPQMIIWMSPSSYIAVMVWGIFKLSNLKRWWYNDQLKPNWRWKKNGMHLKSKKFWGRKGFYSKKSCKEFSRSFGFKVFILAR